MAQFTQYPFSLMTTFGKLPGLLLLCGLMVACTRAAPTLSPTPPSTDTIAPMQTASPIPATETLTATLLPTAIPTNTPTMPIYTATPTQTVSLISWPATITDVKGVPMVFIPAGSFEMGGNVDVAASECQKFCPSCSCSKDNYTSEEPIHTVTLDAFYMDIYEVTNARYAECVDAGKCSAPSESYSYTRSSYYANAQYADYPVIYVSWHDANTYCTWRDARLPTEAEWEKAARGGLDGKQYSWGNTFDGDLANFCDTNCSFDWKNTDYNDGYADTSPVGNYAANGYGLYDMAGNVWEWVADWCDASYYSTSPAENPQGPPSGEYRVLRGGSWYFSPDYLRASYRFRNTSSGGSVSYGFRCSRSP